MYPRADVHSIGCFGRESCCARTTTDRNSDVRQIRHRDHSPESKHRLRPRHRRAPRAGQAAVGILAKECSSKACRGLASAGSHDATRPHQFRSPIDEANRKIIRTAASVGVTGAIEVHVDDPQNEQSNQCGGNGFQNLLTARTSSSAACSPRSGRRLSPRIISFAEFYPLFFPAPVHRSVYPSSEFLA